MPQPVFDSQHPTRAPMITFGQAFSILSAVHKVCFILSRDKGEPDEMAVFYSKEPTEVEDCEICGEGADDEMGEFLTDDGLSVIAHGQCGLDQGYRLA